MATREIKLKNISLADKYRKASSELRAEKKEHAKHNKENESTIKMQSDKIGALESELARLEKLLQTREEQESLIICKNDNGLITNITYTQAYNERVALQEVKGVNLLTITKTPLYAKIPFLQLNNGSIEINEKQYKKYLGGLI